MNDAAQSYAIRKWVTFSEEILHERGPAPSNAFVRAAAGVIIANPFADREVDDLSALTAPSASLGTELARRASSLLGGRPVESYGKGGIAGLAGEQEHVVACITTVFGDALRAGIGGGAAWISSATKTAAAGTSIDIPLAHKDALYVRSHYDAVTFVVPDGPRPNELLIVVAVSTGGRPHQRVGGLAAADIIGDGVH